MTDAPLWHAVITGETASKANSRRAVPRVSRTGKAFVGFIKSDKARDFERDAMRQLMALRPTPPITGPLTLVCQIFYRTNRPDLDESLVMDVLQKSGVILNDRQFVEKVIKKGIDADRPRVEIWLWRPYEVIA